jgi:hypothetical protein
VRGWLRVEAWRVRFDSQKRFDVFVRANAELSRGNVCAPEPRGQRAVVSKFRIGFDEILSDALNVPAPVDLGKASDLFARQLKHAGALLSVFHSLRRAN